MQTTVTMNPRYKLALSDRLSGVSLRVRRASMTTLMNGSLAATRSLISIFTIAILVRYLGKESYGLCLTITGMVNWLGLTQGGLGQSLKNELIHTQIALGDAGGEACEGNVAATRLFSTAFVFLVILMTGTGLVLTLIAGVLPWPLILNYPDFYQDPRYLHLILTSLWIILITIPFSMVRAAYSAFQLEYKLSPYLIFGLFAGLLFFLIAIRTNAGQTVAITSPLIANLVGLIVGAAFMPRALGVRLRWSLVQFSVLRGLYRAGVWFLIMEASWVLIVQADIFLVNLILGSGYATVFALHAQMFSYAQAAVLLLITPYWSAIGDAWRKGERAWLRSWVRRLAAASVGVTACWLAAMQLAGRPLMERWSHGQVEWNPLLALAIGANVLVQSVTGVYSTALGSLGIARDQGRMMVLQAILNVMVCYLLIRRLGVIGAALGSFITYSLTSAWYIPFRLRLALRTSLRTPGRAGQSA